MGGWIAKENGHKLRMTFDTIIVPVFLVVPGVYAFNGVNWRDEDDTHDEQGQKIFVDDNPEDHRSEAEPVVGCKRVTMHPFEYKADTTPSAVTTKDCSSCPYSPSNLPTLKQ